MRKSDLADMAVRVDGDSLLIKLAGVVTLGTMRSLRRTIFRYAMRYDLGRVLVDLSSAALFMGAGEWLVLTQDSASRNAIRITTGLLVGEPAADEAWNHCERLSDYGRICLDVHRSERRLPLGWACGWSSCCGSAGGSGFCGRNAAMYALAIAALPTCPDP
jgi:hypothetical protein